MSGIKMKKFITTVIFFNFIFFTFYAYCAKIKILDNARVLGTTNVSNNMIANQGIFVQGNLTALSIVGQSSSISVDGQVENNQVAQFANNTGSLLKGANAKIDSLGNISIDGITKNGNTVSWPSNIGALGTFLATDGAGNLYYTSSTGQGNVSTVVLFDENNRLVSTDTPNGPTNIKQTDVILDTANDLKGVDNLTSNTVYGNLIGTASSADVATIFTNQLSGDVSGSFNSTIVEDVDGQSPVNIESAVDTISTATSSNTPWAVVKRDDTGQIFASTVYARLIGNISGNVFGPAASAITTTSASGFTDPLYGDVTGNQSSTVVSFVGGKSASSVSQATISANNATDSNIANYIAKRDSLGDFDASVLRANLLVGNVTGNIFGQANSAILADFTKDFNDPFSGDVTGVQSATVVSSVGGYPALTIVAAIDNIFSATSENVASTIAKRDEFGSFKATKIYSDLLGSVTGSLYGQADSATFAQTAGNADSTIDFIGSLTGDVTGKQWATVVSQVGGRSAGYISSAVDMVNSATSENVANEIVFRDSSGNFISNMMTITGSISALTDVATKQYVDNSVLTAIDPKQPAIVNSQTNIASLYGLQTIDGVALQENNRVLLLAQTDQIDNGLWLAQDLASWIRPSDFSNGSTAQGAYILTTSGISGAGSSWLCDTPSAIIGTDNITFKNFIMPGQTTAANIGSGAGKVFIDKTGLVLNLKSIASGDSHILITNDTNEIVISTDATSENIPGTIIARDSLGSFSANLIGSASNNVLKAGDTMSGSLLFSNGLAGRSGLVLNNLTNSGGIFLRAPSSIDSSYSVSLPSSAPSAGKFLQAESGGTTEWVTIGALPVATRIYHVSIAGSDSNDGSLTFPFRTVAHAVSQANAISSLSNPVTVDVGPGVFDEDNSGGAILIDADGISIVGTSMTSTIIRPNSVGSTNDLFSSNVSNFEFSNLALQGRDSTMAGIRLNSYEYGKIQFDSISVNSFEKAFDLHSVSGDYPIVYLQNIQASGNATSIYINNTKIFLKASAIKGALTTGIENTGVALTGSGALAEIYDTNLISCNVGVSINGGAYLNISNCTIESSNNGVVCSGASKTNVIGSSFLLNNDNTINFRAQDSGTIAYIESSIFDCANGLISTGTAIVVTDAAKVYFNNSTVDGAYCAVESGKDTDIQSTAFVSNCSNLINCPLDLKQRGLATLQFVGGTIETAGLEISDPTNVSLVSFSSNYNATLSFGNTYDMTQPVFKIINEQAIPPLLEYETNFYGYKGMLCKNLNDAPSQSFSGIYTQAGDASYQVVVGDRDKEASIKLISDSSLTPGLGTNVIGWNISKAATTGDLLFSYTNNDTANIGPNVVMKLTGVDNNVEFPTAQNSPYTTPKLIWVGDTNIYRDSVGVLKTDGDLILDALTTDRVVQTDSSKKLESSSVTSTELGYLSGISSSLQDQLDSKVSRSGDVMTGNLVLPAGFVSDPSLQFLTGSATGLSAQIANSIIFSTTGQERMRLDPNGTVYIDQLDFSGVLHNDSSGKLTSSLIINSDIISDAGITDSKLATISTPGKVENSATSASSVNTFGSIVSRDSNGTFTATTIYANLEGTATSASEFFGRFYGDVIGTQTATVVAYIANGANSVSDFNLAFDAVSTVTSSSTPLTIAKRDSSGNIDSNMVTILGAVLNSNYASNKGYVDATVKQMHKGTLLSSGLNTITQAGLYTLNENLTANVLINSDNVTIDLSDFTIYSAGPDAVIEVGSGYKNIQIKNGKIRGTSTNDGILINQNCQLINLSNLKILSCNNGLNCNGSAGSVVKRGKALECNFDLCNKGVSLNYTEKFVFKNCATYNCVYTGFEQRYCKYNVCESCQSFETVNNSSDYDAIGFSSFAGQGNLFNGCLAEGTTKSAGSYTNKTKRAIGFLLNGALGSMENQSKIINSIANTSLVNTTDCRAYGILLDPFVISDATLNLVTNFYISSFGSFFFRWSPCGNYLVSSGSTTYNSNTSSIFKFDGRNLNYIGGMNGAATTSAPVWSPDGKYIANVSGASNLIKIWKFNGTALINSGPTLSVTTCNVLDWHPSGKYLAYGTSSSNPVKVGVVKFNENSLYQVANVNSTYTDVTCCKWSPDGKYLAVAGDLGLITIYYFTGSALIPYSQYTSDNIVYNYGMSWSPDGQYIAFGTSSSKLIILKFNPTLADFSSRLQYITMYTSSLSVVTCVDWSSNGNYVLLSSTGVRTVAVFSFNGTSLSLASSYNFSGALGYSALFDPTGTYICLTGTSYSGADQGLKIFKFADTCYNCLIQENRACNSTSYLSTGTVKSYQAIGICASGDNLYIKNVGFANDINFNKAVYNNYGQSLISSYTLNSQTSLKSYDNLWQPPYEAAYGVGY